MRKAFVIFLSLWVVFLGRGFAQAQESTLLTLEEALARVEYHADYQAWLASLEQVEATIQSIADKHSVGLDLSGNLLKYTYNFEQDNSQLSSGGSLSLSKSNLMGSTLSGSISPSFRLSDGELNTSWSIGLQQTIWPAPRLSSDQISLSLAEQRLDVLVKQGEYVTAQARSKIEELYRLAQLAQARLVFAETSLDQAHSALAMTTQKVELGEASEADLINANLGILRGERDLESSSKSALSAMESLLAAIELEGTYALESLELHAPPRSGGGISLPLSLAEPQRHPLVLGYEADLVAAELELEAAQELKKPQAGLSLSLTESPLSQTGGGLRFEATVSLGYRLLDHGQRSKTLDGKTDSLESAEKAYADALEQVRTSLEEGLAELNRLAREEEIARLNLRKLELEWETIQIQRDLGMLEPSSLRSAEMALYQGQLDLWEASYRYDLAKRRIEQGIVGDLPGGMSR